MHACCSQRSPCNTLYLHVYVISVQVEKSRTGLLALCCCQSTQLLAGAIACVTKQICLICTAFHFCIYMSLFSVATVTHSGVLQLFQ